MDTNGNINKRSIVIGDIHGRDVWKKIIEHENPNRVIFIGDYFDSFDIPGVDQIHNFKEIIEYKQNTKTEVIMLIGNHDYHYFPEIGDCGTSGYQRGIAPNIIQVIDENRHHLQMAYNFGDFVFTHAGVSEQFMDQTFGKTNWNVESMVVDLNEMFKYKPLAFMFNGFNAYGDDLWQTPIWIRPKSLMEVNRDYLRKEIIQVVGHTSMKQINIEGKAIGDRYHFIDCLGTSGEYLIITDGEVTVNSYKNYGK